MSKAVQINHEGKLSIGGVEIKDSSFGLPFFESLHLEKFVCMGFVDGEKIIVESSSAPLVVQKVSESTKGLIDLEYAYGFIERISLESCPLYLDDWSRLCGENKKGVPFVFSISAQTEFLSKIVEPLDYETFSYGEKEHELQDWYVENPESLQSSFWTTKYKENSTPWDLSTYHPCLDWTIPRLKLFKSKILVAGSGKGHDAHKLSQIGHNVTAVDFSNEAINQAKEKYGKSVNFLEEDVFSFSKKNEESFDIVFEHTLFCALSPEKRAKLIKSWKYVLREGGYLMGIFLVASKRSGPPFGITEWELRELLEKDFKIDYWGRLRGKESARPGKELFVYAQKKK